MSEDKVLNLQKRVSALEKQIQTLLMSSESLEQTKRRYFWANTHEEGCAIRTRATEKHGDAFCFGDEVYTRGKYVKIAFSIEKNDQSYEESTGYHTKRKIVTVFSCVSNIGHIEMLETNCSHIRAALYLYFKKEYPNYINIQVEFNNYDLNHVTIYAQSEANISSSIWCDAPCDSDSD